MVTAQNENPITQLSMISQVKPLRVISGGTASVMATTDRSIPEIAEEINVDYLIEGAILSIDPV
jgi:TolB-like protein